MDTLRAAPWCQPIKRVDEGWRYPERPQPDETPAPPIMHGIRRRIDRMHYFDAHVHVWPGAEAGYQLAPGVSRADHVKPDSFTPEELLAHTRANGVNHVNLIQVSFHGLDNRYLLEAITRYPDIFTGTVMIDPLAAGAADEMAAMSRRGVRAIRIWPKLSGQPPQRWLEPAGYAKVFAAGAKLNMAMNCSIAPEGLAELDRMCLKFPQTPVIIDHLCRIGKDEPIHEPHVEALCAMARHPRVMVKVGGFYALGKKQPPYLDLAPLIERVIGAFGAARCMWESDSPYQVQPPHAYADSLALVRDHLPFLTEQDQQWLLRGTAEAFYLNA